MDSSLDPLTLALTGQLPFVGIAAPILALPVSGLLLWLYRRAVIAAMQRQSVPRPSEPRPAGPHDGDPADDSPIGADVSPRGVTTPQRETGTGLADTARKRELQLLGIHAAGGLAFAAVLAVAFLVSSGTPLLPLRFGLLTWVYAWPIVISTVLLAADDRTLRVRVLGVYAAGFALLGGLAIARSDQLTLGQLVLLFAIMNGPPSILLLAFWNRRIRAVGSLVLVFLGVAITGSLAMLAIVGGSDDLLRNAAAVAAGLGIGARGAILAIVVAGFVVFGGLGWLLLRWIGAAYRAKRLSDQSLSLGALWLLFALSDSIGLAFEGAPWVLSGLVAFAAYRVTVAVALRRLRAPGRDDAHGARLLVLRVFALGARSERLFEAVAARWRQVGSVQLIAGPDLATTTVEPHEFLEFLSGRLSGLFIEDARALERRMHDLDLEPDRDGRFRVNEFFCFEDTWQQVLRRLVGETDAVLMDLRGFAPEHAGCRVELRALAERVPLERVTFVVDGDTDTRLLEAELREATSSSRFAQAESAQEAEAPTQFRLDRADAGGIPALIQVLGEAAGRSSARTS